jgi:quercetin dioxygenase-like cupin family protein
MTRTRWLLAALLCGALAVSLCTGAEGDEHALHAPPMSSSPPPYAYATNGVLDADGGQSGVHWKVVVDKSNLGGDEIEIAEATLPAGTTVGSHPHRSIEIIYVLSGVYDHEVNGKRYRLKPGMVGIVRPGDKVRHLVPKDGEAKLLILWAPAGEVARILSKATGTTPESVPEEQN